MPLSAAPQSSVPGANAAAWRSLVLAALTYAALVLVMWLPFNPCGGMPYESHFLFNSEVWPIWGFLFPSDPMRPHTSTFYHVSFWLGEVLGIGGSFVPFQMVYAALWWARGFLVFLILRRLLPAESLLSFCGGALVIAHASDHALLWVGQLNQFGFIFWMLLAFYLFVLAVQSPSVRQTQWLVAGAAAAQHMSLWSYESQLLLMLAAPFGVLFRERQRLRAKALVIVAWYAVPALYLLTTAYGYVTRAAGSYQASVLRTDWSFAAIASDWWFNLRASLEFWGWAGNVSWDLSSDWLTGLGLLSAAVYVSGATGTALLQGENERSSFLSPRGWLCLLLVGMAALVLSFPAYLSLASAATLWRTQFLSGIGAALVWASLAGLAASLLPRHWPRLGGFLVVGALVTSFGTTSALRFGAMHDGIWKRHRQAFEALLELAPRLPERSVVVAVNAPKANDPFGHNMWFNFALKLAYPGSRVSGIYFHDDGTPAAGNHLHMDSGDWVWDGSFESPGYERRGVENTVVVGYDGVKTARILDELPDAVSPSQEARARYSPRTVILEGPPSPRAVRRYFPCPQWWWTLSPEM